MENICH